MAQELLRAVQENKMSELSQHLDKKSKQKMDTIEKTEQLYLKTSVWTLAKNRIIWLLILMISATVTGAIIQGFEDVLQSVVILASFIPMLMDTGGNSGSQSSTLIIRGLALGEITTKDIFKVIFKEFKVSIVVAIALEDMKGHVEDYFGDDAMVKHMYELKQAGVTLKVYLKKLIYPIGVLCIVYLILFLKKRF